MINWSDIEGKWFLPVLPRTINEGNLFDCLPHQVFKPDEKGYICYMRMGVRTLLPTFFNSEEHMCRVVDFSRPLTDKQAEQVYDEIGKIYDRIKRDGREAEKQLPEDLDQKNTSPTE